MMRKEITATVIKAHSDVNESTAIPCEWTENRTRDNFRHLNGLHSLEEQTLLETNLDLQVD